VPKLNTTISYQIQIKTNMNSFLKHSLTKKDMLSTHYINKPMKIKFGSKKFRLPKKVVMTKMYFTSLMMYT
jgi:hypothetical protein